MTKIFLFSAIGLFILGLAGTVGFYTYSTQPSFCHSCHIMEPYYNAWKTSKHFGKAVCVDCHYPPATSFREHLWHKFQASAQVVKYITRTYSSKPFAKIQDASCLRSGCHSTRLLEGQMVTEARIKFDHRPHLAETRRDRKLACVSCHSQIVVGRHIEVTYSPCFLCHFRDKDATTPPTAACLTCHTLPTATFQLGTMTYNHKDFVTARGLSCKNCHLDVVHGEGKAEQDRCLTCHNQPEKLARFGDIQFIHDNHVTKHHVACLHCHDEMVHGRPEGEKTPRLNEPPIPETQPAMGHPPTLAFECSFCHEAKHSGQLEMYTGKVESLGLPSIASPMFQANVDCIGCHYREKMEGEEQEFRGHTVAASPQACVKCHGPEFEGILKQTKFEIDSTLGPIASKREGVVKALEAKGLPADEKDRLKGEIDQAERLERFVRLSRGEHNIYLASVALRKVDQLLSGVASKLGAPAADLNSLPLMSGSYCATTCHQQLKVKVPPETVTVAGKTMPHLEHTTLLGCVDCHQIGAHKEVPLIPEVRTKVCLTCHSE